MTVIGLDDTDSRERGMCTTYLAARLAESLAAERTLLVRLNPAVEHKTRGNAALAVHTDADPENAFELARREIAGAAETDDPNTEPGLVVAPGDPDDVSDDVASFARDATRDFLSLDDAVDLIDANDYRAEGWASGRGRIGALAAVGAWRATDDWTYEHIAYRELARWGTPREVDRDSVFAAANEGYPNAWDTVDRVEGEAVCVPHTPGPVLYGVRGDDPDVVRSVADGIESEPVHATRLFVTNQGTDVHLRASSVGDLRDGRAYRVNGTVTTAPETRRGGHVFFSLRGNDVPLSAGDSSPTTTEEPSPAADGGSTWVDAPTVQCAAFEPTKRFRDRVRALRPGDRITACGEVAAGTLKLEKFAVRSLVTTERVTPTCPACTRRMESAGADQGYRCRDCDTERDGKEQQRVQRDLEPGWYEVPPCARRHIAKPLVRGGFDAPVHPER